VDAQRFAARRMAGQVGGKACEAITKRADREMLQRTAKSCVLDAPTLASTVRGVSQPA